MAAIALTSTSLAALKKSLSYEFDEAKSSHISEAVAYSLGFRTNAALLAAMPAVYPEEAPYVVLSTERMLERLGQFGYPPDPDFDFEMLMKPVPEVISTIPISGYEIHYNTLRQKAWRNLMVCATNAALAQGLFTLRPGDNRFGTEKRFFDFTLPGGLAARGWVGGAGYDELAIRAAVQPKGDAVRFSHPTFDAGDAHGGTWVERRFGAWIQSSHSLFTCRRPLLPVLAELTVDPKGYGDRGKVIM